MNLFNAKKMIVGVVLSSAALYSQQALAADRYLYCTKENPGVGQWDWANINHAKFDKQPVNSALGISELAGVFLKLKGDTASPHTDINGIFLVENGRQRDLGQAKEICRELQRFCPASGNYNTIEDIQSKDYIYLGAASNGGSAKREVGVTFKHNPNDQYNNILLCPSWEYEKGVRNQHCGRIYNEKPALIMGTYYDRGDTQDLGLCGR